MSQLDVAWTFPVTGTIIFNLIVVDQVMFLQASGNTLVAVDAANQFTGQIYEERGRAFLAMRGQFSYIPDGGGPKVVGALQSTDDELLKMIKVNDWNQAHVIASGNMITEILNGQVTSVVVDDDTKGRALKGSSAFRFMSANR